MRIDRERLITEFVSLISIDSKSFHEKKMADYLKHRLADLGFTVSEDDAGERLGGSCGNIYGYWKGAEDNTGEAGVTPGTGAPLLFCCHMDTVEPCLGKKAVFEEDGTIKSGGETILGADDCSGIAAILEALTVIRDQNLSHRPIEVLFTVAEEVHCKGGSCFDFSSLRSGEAYVLDLAGPVGYAAYKAPSILTLSITITGKAAHAGFAPEKGIHAIQAASKAIAELELGRIDDETTLNIGTIQGGLATNIIPEHCAITGEIRSYDHAKALTAAETVKNHFIRTAEAMGASASVEVRTHCEAYEIQPNDPVALRFSKICRDQGLSGELLETFGGSDNHHLVKHGIRGLVLSNAMNDCHSCEEYTTVDELCRIAELTLSLMLSQD